MISEGGSEVIVHAPMYPELPVAPLVELKDDGTARVVTDIGAVFSVLIQAQGFRRPGPHPSPETSKK